MTSLVYFNSNSRRRIAWELFILRQHLRELLFSLRLRELLDSHQLRESLFSSTSRITQFSSTSRITFLFNFDNYLILINFENYFSQLRELFNSHQLWESLFSATFLHVVLAYPDFILPCWIFLKANFRWEKYFS